MAHVDRRWTSVPPLTPRSSSPSVPCRVFHGAAMSTLYPSLEDLKVDQAIQVRRQAHVSLGPLMEPSGSPRAAKGGWSWTLVGGWAPGMQVTPKGPAERGRCPEAKAMESQQEWKQPGTCGQASVVPALSQPLLHQVQSPPHWPSQPPQSPSSLHPICGLSGC